MNTVDIAITGATGMLGSDLVPTLENAGHKVWALAEADCDITNADSVTRVLDGITNLKWVINCAAYTAVDECETKEELATRINGEGPGILAKYCAKRGIPIIHFSTDYVFDGTKEEMYNEDDKTNPINAYGRSKLAGENAVKKACEKHLIFRIQWLYGAAGPNFIKTMLKLAETKRQLNVISDQLGTPTWTQTVSNAIVYVLNHTPTWGTYHLRASGQTNWAEFAQTIFDCAGKQVRVLPIASEEYPRPAKRPKNGVLSTYKLLKAGYPQLPHWHYCLEQYLSKNH
ncbi:MAG: dTDP-4-dehydrorhamnose reductase [bacterium]|nr:dTDP-4-dehydrorhamnose reductase [bacterium]